MAMEKYMKKMLLLGLVACFIEASEAYYCPSEYPFDECPRVFDPYYETVCCQVNGIYQCCDETIIALWAWIFISFVLIIVIGILTLILCCVCPCCIIAARKRNRRPPVVVEYTIDGQGGQNAGPATYPPPNSVQPYLPYQFSTEGMPEKVGLLPPPAYESTIENKNNEAPYESTVYGATAAYGSNGATAVPPPVPVSPPDPTSSSET